MLSIVKFKPSNAGNCDINLSVSEFFKKVYAVMGGVKILVRSYFLGYVRL